MNWRKAHRNKRKPKIGVFVVGDSSPNPDYWIDGFCLVLAHTKREAVSIAKVEHPWTFYGDSNRIHCAKVEMSPRILVYVPEPSNDE